MGKKTDISLILTYIFLWGMQFSGTLFSIFIDSLPFTTAETIANISSVNSVVIMLSQFAWTKVADRTRNKTNLIALSLFMIIFSSITFYFCELNIVLLYVLVIIYNAAFCAHTPLIDTVTAEHTRTAKRPFAFYRSFGTLGYALIGIVFALIPNMEAKGGFIFMAAFAVLSIISSRFIGIRSEISLPKQKRSYNGVFNKRFILLLVYFFIYSIGTTFMNIYTSIYFTSEEHLGGSVNTYVAVLTVATVIEWLVLLLLVRFNRLFSNKLRYLLIPVFCLIKAGLLFLSPNCTVAIIAMAFQGFQHAFLWSSITPYIAKIVPRENLASAQGICNIAMSGIAPLIGAFICGRIVGIIGIRPLFLITVIIMIAVILFTPFLFSKRIACDDV